MNALYLPSMLAHAYKIIIYLGVGTLGHGREVIEGLNATNKSFISMLIITMQLPGEEAYELQMAMHTSTENTDISLAREFQKHLSDPTQVHGLLDHGKDRKRSSKRKWANCEYIYKEIKDMLHI